MEDRAGQDWRQYDRSRYHLFWIASLFAESGGAFEAYIGEDAEDDRLSDSSEAGTLQAGLFHVEGKAMMLPPKEANYRDDRNRNDLKAKTQPLRRSGCRGVRRRHRPER